MNPVLVKVCGVTDADNALACVAAGADYLGLNFHPPSPRSLTIDQAVPLAQAVQGRVELVGLFVDLPIATVATILAAIPAIRTVQLHGAEPPVFLRVCRSLPYPPRIIRAFRLKDSADVTAMNDYLADAARLEASPDAILVDALVAGALGGTGHAIPLHVLSSLPGHPRLILAGGLNPANVVERIRLVQPWMVDVASGVESAPGWKDPALVAAFVAAARQAERNPVEPG